MKEFSEAFQDASIQFLDDQRKYLQNTTELFKGIGKEIIPLNNIEHALHQALTNNVDIFLSDLDLSNISKAKNGFNILAAVREKNDSIFLGLYTAFENSLNTQQQDFLIKKRIKVYTKDKQMEFLADLKYDYNKFKETQYEEEKIIEKMGNQFFSMIHKDVLDHLRNVSNQEIYIPVKQQQGGDIEIKITDLYNEVYKRSLIGMAFIACWYDNMKFINSLDKKNNHG